MAKQIIDDNLIQEVIALIDEFGGRRIGYRKFVAERLSTAVSAETISKMVEIIDGKKEMPTRVTGKMTEDIMAYMTGNPFATPTQIGQYFGIGIHSAMGYRAAAKKAGLVADLVAGPNSVMDRTLLARTCVVCDLLLPGKFFFFKNSNRAADKYVSVCRRCRNKAERSAGRRGPEQVAKDKLQALSLENATHHREPWTQKELDYLTASPQTPPIVQALKLGRTYYTVLTRRQRVEGGTRYKHKGDPASEQWYIRFERGESAA